MGHAQQCRQGSKKDEPFEKCHKPPYRLMHQNGLTALWSRCFDTDPCAGAKEKSLLA
jgi:hypothetical protein